MKKYIIMVAGYDYGGGGARFEYIADKRRKYILRQNPTWANDPNVIFVRFDVRHGKVEKNISNGSRRSWVLETTYTAISRRRHYTGRTFKSQNTNVISIVDAYKYIINLGKTEPGTVQEFTILGHGWMGGPVLVNSYERPQYKRGGANVGQKDPWDKDGRLKDFLDTAMNDADWLNFKRAFAELGFIWVWGCVFTRAYYNTLYKVMRSRDFRAKRFGTHVDTDNITISVSASFVRKYYHADRNFFPTDPTVRTFTRTFLQIKQFLMRGLRNTYAGRVAADTGIECRAGYIGTYSTYERSYAGHRRRHTIMEIPRNHRVYGDNFTRTINFYKTYLNLPEDPENRGYARYRSAQVWTWWDV